VDKLGGVFSSKRQLGPGVTTRERGAWLGWAGVDPPGHGGGQGF